MRSDLVGSILAAHRAGGDATGRPRPGDVVALAPSTILTHDNTSAIAARFRAIGAARVVRPERCVVVLDHDVQNRAAPHLEKYAAIERFAREQGMEFHGAGSGIGHQVMVETLRVLPGMLAVAADSHATTYGALGALAVPLARADAAGVWAAGLFWWEVPPVVRVVLEGRLPAGSTGKDVVLVLCSLYPEDVLGCAVEIGGPGLASLTMDDRLTVANMTAEWGAAACVFETDEITRAWLASRGRLSPEAAASATVGDGAAAATIVLDLDGVGPHVAGPDEVSHAVPLAEIAARRVRVDKAYLVSCANARASDLDAAADVLAGRRVAPHVEFYVAAASAAVERDAAARGTWRTLLDAGARPLPSGCGPCIGLGAGLLAPGETGISASNRNFKGRMGSTEATCYLASPAIVAASALAGYVTGPLRDGPDPPPPERRLERHAAAARRDGSRDPWRGPAAPEPSGRAHVYLKDGVDTDALCPASLVYDDAATPERLAAAVLRGVDPEFAARVGSGDVLLAGRRFGIGSSREQAARALAALGLRAVVAGSLAPIFRRNAWNNGFLALEAPELPAALAGAFPEAALRPRAIEAGVTLDLAAWTIRVGSIEAALSPLPAIARELIEGGGLDGFIRGRMRGGAAS